MACHRSDNIRSMGCLPRLVAPNVHGENANGLSHPCMLPSYNHLTLIIFPLRAAIKSDVFPDSDVAWRQASRSCLVCAGARLSRNPPPQLPETHLFNWTFAPSLLFSNANVKTDLWQTTQRVNLHLSCHITNPHVKTSASICPKIPYHRGNNPSR